MSCGRRSRRCRRCSAAPIHSTPTRSTKRSRCQPTSHTQRAKLEHLRKRRDNDNVKRTLEALGDAAGGSEKLMPYILDAVRAYATLGEMCDTLRHVWGEYEEVPIICPSGQVSRSA